MQNLCILLILFFYFSIMLPDKVESNSARKVVVVGGGMAGLASSLEALSKGANVVLLDGQISTGGNSAKATSGINGCNTEAQRIKSIKDSHDMFFSDTLNAGHLENDRDLIDVMVDEASSAIDFLNSLSPDLKLNEVSIGGGHSVPRTHSFPMPTDGRLIPFGATVMKLAFEALKKLAESTQRIQIMTKSRVIELIMSSDEPRRVIGVKIQKQDGNILELLSDAVILATGGFCNDHDPQTSLLEKYVQNVLHFPTTNGPFADGSGMKMAEKIGAQLIDMDKVQIHPTGFVDPNDPKATTKFLAAEALRGSGAILLNERGERFANELGLRDYLTREILQHCSNNKTTGYPTAYMILNQKAVDKFGRPAFDFYWKRKGFFKLAQNVNDLSRIIDVDESTLEETFKSYNKHCLNSGQDRFNKTVFPIKYDLNEQFYVGTITPVLHYSMGGVKINARAQVLNKTDKKPIRGLYAAGEVVGGIHGGNRLSGNSYLDCVVFGRIAGSNAALDIAE